MKSIKNLILTIIAANVLLSGCTTFQSFPYIARAGDTIALAIGSPDGMNTGNTTAVYVSKSDPGYPNTPTEYPLTIRSIFKLYADKASPQYARNSTATQITKSSGHEHWITIAAIDTPTTLPTGAGEVRFTSTAPYPTIGSHINDFPIDVELLPASAGTGSPATFPYEVGVGQTAIGNLGELEAVPHAAVFSNFNPSASWPTYGAIEVLVNAPNTATSVLDRAVRMYAEDIMSTTNSKRSFTSRLTNNQDIQLILLSPTGKLAYYEPRFTIIMPNGVDYVGTPTITAVNYYDINGDSVAGPPITDYTVEVR